MGTLIACTLVHVVAPGGSCQTVSLARSTARATVAPPGLGTSVAVPGASGGSGRQRVLALAIMSARIPGMMIPAVPPGPNDAEADVAPLSLTGRDKCSALAGWRRACAG